ncbi:MAG: Toprim subdomain protein [Candidatus Methanomethylophilaceae archaeon]
MRDGERLELLDVVLDDLDAMAADHIILIEGIKDRASLERLIGGFECFMVQREGGPLRAAEYVNGRGSKAVILTDWDNKGEYLAHELSVQLDAMCIEYDTDIRRRLADLCRRDIKDVESLHSLYDRLVRSCDGANSRA